MFQNKFEINIFENGEDIILGASRKNVLREDSGVASVGRVVKTGLKDKKSIRGKDRGKKLYI